jgi:hypothetical protein
VGWLLLVLGASSSGGSVPRIALHSTHEDTRVCKPRDGGARMPDVAVLLAHAACLLSARNG